MKKKKKSDLLHLLYSLVDIVVETGLAFYSILVRMFINSELFCIVS